MPPTGVSEGQKFALQPAFKNIGMSLGNIFWAKVGDDADSLRKWIATVKPRFLIINCEQTLRLIHPWGTLDKCRGGIYDLLGIKAICIGDLKHLHSVKHGRWLLAHDLSKLARWINGSQRQQTAFRYRICRTVDDVVDACKFLSRCLLVATDIETFGHTVRCVGYYGVHEDGSTRGFVVPFYNAFSVDKCHWSEPSEEAFVWKELQRLHESNSAKILQNGSYDQAYFIRYRIPCSSQLLDSLHLWHSIFCELPKKINFIASVVLDYYCFWKDEGKGTSEEKRKSTPKFKDEKSQENYWRYCALDCYYTFWCGWYLSRMITTPPFKWALVNFIDEMLLQFGSAQSGSMKGFRSDTKRLEVLHHESYAKGSRRLEELKVIADDDRFNPSSPQQYASLLYDVLGAKPVKIKGQVAKTAAKNDGKSTDEKILKKIREEQHPILGYVINKVFDCKKPYNDISKYVKMRRWENERFLYQLNAAGTETTRFSGNNHQFWVGTNPQNVPIRLRHLVAIADQGYVFFEADYAQSDAKFVAYESEDSNYIEVMERPNFDSHSYHAAHFFKRYTYEQVNQGNIDRIPIFAEEPFGVRPLSKKFVHGGNYDMSGWTLFIWIGREVTIAAAIAAGYKDAGVWSEKMLVNFCQATIDSLWKLYPRVPEWKKEEIERALKNNNRVTNCFGRTRQMIGDLKNDKGMQRELIAFLGQSATGGNINRALNTIHYGNERHDLRFHFLTQTHDSMLFLFPLENYHECAQYVLTTMEKPVIVKGREMFVRADAKIGFSWGKGLTKYKKDLSVEAIMDNELKLREEWRWKKRKPIYLSS